MRDNVFTMTLTTTDLAIACVCGCGFYLLHLIVFGDVDRKRRKAVPRFMRQRSKGGAL